MIRKLFASCSWTARGLFMGCLSAVRELFGSSLQAVRVLFVGVRGIFGGPDGLWPDLRTRRQKAAGSKQREPNFVGHNICDKHLDKPLQPKPLGLNFCG